MKLHLDNAFKWIVVKNALENDKERMQNADFPEVHESDIEIIEELLAEMDEKCCYKKPE